MTASQRWARNFTLSEDDIEFLMGLLLEKETPLSTEELAHALIQHQLDQEIARLEERYHDVETYNPSINYSVGQRLLFPHFDNAIGNVTAIRAGDNPDYGDFAVVSVEFEDPVFNTQKKPREFASGLTRTHKLDVPDTNGANPLVAYQALSAEEIIAASGGAIPELLAEGLAANGNLVNVTKKWFPYDLLLDVDVGHLNLAEAVLDMAGGSPLAIRDVVQQIGGIGESPIQLQEFSLNLAMNEDDRFDEVGPAGEVLWYLTRLEPPEVQRTPAELQYTPIEYDRNLLSAAALTLEAEIDDELSPITEERTAFDQVTVTLNYPHRRRGTLPLTSKLRTIFPTALRTSRIWITLVDGQDGEEYPGWVLPDAGYVFGLAEIYSKHELPVGTYVTVIPTETRDRITINFKKYRPRTEWVRLIHPQKGRLSFENQKRSIGAEYDDLVILGVDDLESLDELAAATRQQQRTIAAILRELVPALGKLTPQGAVHAKTLYSATNVLRRCPPGPILATLVANPAFEDVGDHYWKLKDD